jgi:raffinose/stachyose/melibiose transport system permease protein
MILPQGHRNTEKSFFRNPYGKAVSTMKRKIAVHSNRQLILFVLPALLLIIAMSELPFLLNFRYSFTKWSGLAKTPVWIGLQNYLVALKDPNFRNSLLFTFKYTIWVVILTNVAALALALVLDGPLNLRNLFRTVFFMPNVIGLIVIGFIWRFIFTRGFDAFYSLTKLPIFSWSWLGDHRLAWISLVLVAVWQSVGYMMVIYIAGLQTIPQDVLESAELEGATGLRKFFAITLPLIMPSVTICFFLTLANNLKVFDLVYALTGGGPGTSTTSISVNIYRESFQASRYGYGTAQAVLFFLIILAVTLIQLRIFKRREVEL